MPSFVFSSNFPSWSLLIRIEHLHLKALNILCWASFFSKSHKEFSSTRASLKLNSEYSMQGWQLLPRSILEACLLPTLSYHFLKCSALSFHHSILLWSPWRWKFVWDSLFLTIGLQWFIFKFLPMVASYSNNIQPFLILDLPS